jgi:hypothetical protein
MSSIAILPKVKLFIKFFEDWRALASLKGLFCNLKNIPALSLEIYSDYEFDNEIIKGFNCLRE